MSAGQGFFGRLDDAMNPIVVRELRQATRGRIIIGLLTLFLIVQWLVLLFALLDGRSGVDFQQGRDAFIALMSVLLVTCMMLIPLYTTVRLSLERAEANMDLLYITALKPRQIVFGKLAASVLLALLIYSACMPFLSLTYLLRGIDLPSIFLILGFGFFGTIISIQIGIFTACIPGSRVVRLISAATGIMVQMTGVGIVLQFGDQLTRWSMSGLSSWDFWLMVVLVLGIITLGAIGLFFLSIAWLSPPSTNRVLPVRVYWTFAWLLTLGVALAHCRYYTNWDALIVWYVLAMFTLSTGILLCACERETLGPRVKKSIPRNLLLRLLVFPFYSGAASGFVWSLLMLAMTAAIGSTLADLLGHSDRPIESCVVIALYAWIYTYLGWQLRRKMMPRSIRQEDTWFVVLVLVLLGSTLPLILLLFAGADNESSLTFLGNPFSVFWLRGRVWEQFAFTLAVGALISAFSVPWLVRRFLEFRRA